MSTADKTILAVQGDSIETKFVSQLFNDSPTLMILKRK